METPKLPEDHTAVKLAKLLREADLNEMADKAEVGYYHDFLSPIDMPSIQLATDLAVAAKTGNKAAGLLLARHYNGDFDASLEESNDWAKSEDGQATLAMIPPHMRHLFEAD